MSTELDSPYGYPLRRNETTSCLATEQDCGPTWGTYRRCCPHGTSCADDCCPSEADCQQRIKSNPHCANDTADLYRAVDANGSPAGGYFCCTNDAIGFQRSIDSFVGCADSVDLLNSSYSLAALIKESTSSSTIISSTASPTASSTASSTATTTGTSSSSSSSSSTNSGVIAGAVVGGVAGAALLLAALWLLIRRRKQQQQNQYQQPAESPSSDRGGAMPGTTTLDSTTQSSMGIGGGVAGGTTAGMPVEQYKPMMLAELQSTTDITTPSSTTHQPMQELEGRRVYELPEQTHRS